MSGLSDFRQQHPEYNDMSDAALADALYKKFYSDMPRADFDAKMGLTAAAPAAEPDVGTRVMQYLDRYGITPAKRIAGDLLTLPQIIAGRLNKDVTDYYAGQGQSVPIWARPKGPNQLAPVVAAIGRGTDAPSAFGRMVQTGLEAGGNAAVMGPLMGAPLAAAPTAAALAVPGGMVQQGLKEAGLPVWAQIAGGILTPIAIGAGYQFLSPKLRAAMLMRQQATNPDAPFNPSQTPNMQLTTAESQNDPGLLNLQRAMEQKNPAKWAGIRSAQNQAIEGDLSQTGAWPANAPEVTQQTQGASIQGREAIANAYDAAKTTEGQLWDAVDPSKSTAFDTAPAKQMLADYISSISKARARFIPQDIKDMIDELAPKEPLLELQDTRSAILSQARALRITNPNAANVLNGLAQEFGDYVDNLPMPDPDMAARYQAARAATRDLHAQFDNPATKALLKTDTTGQPLAPPSTVITKYLNGTPEGLDNYLKAAGNDPDAIQAAHDWLLAGLKGKAMSTQVDSTGAPYLLPAGYGKFYAKYENYFNDSRLFTPDEQAILQRSKDSLVSMNLAANAAPRGGPDTYAKFAKGDYLDAFLGQRATNFLKAAGAFFGWMGGGLPGGIAGGVAGGGVGKALSWSGTRVLSLTERAMTDPQFAQELRMFMKNPGLPTLTPALQGALGVAATNLPPAAGYYGR